MPAAHSISVSPKGVHLRQYWSPDLSLELRLRSDEEYAEALREVFTEAVRCRMRSAFPLGSMLSGGLDSSSIACTARDLLSQSEGQRLHTFSAIFPDLATADPRIDERHFIGAVLRGGGFEPHDVRCDHLNPLMDLLWGGDETMPGPNLYMDHALFSAAREQGVRVVLSGIDGDSTLSYGYEYLSELARKGKWRTLSREALAVARRAQTSRQRIIWKLGVQPLVPQPLLRFAEIIRGHKRHPWRAQTAIDPGFAQLYQFPEDAGRRPRDARETHWRSLGSGLIAFALELLDTVAAPFAVEVRYPFFDRRMVEFCLALPAEQKLQ